MRKLHIWVISSILRMQEWVMKEARKSSEVSAKDYKDMLSKSSGSKAYLNQRLVELKTRNR